MQQINLYQPIFRRPTPLFSARAMAQSLLLMLLVLGGVYGWVGTFRPGAAAPVGELSVTTDDVHAMWGDGEGRIYGVGGRFADPFRGVAVVRTEAEAP